jgi:hypothetical protein
VVVEAISHHAPERAREHVEASILRDTERLLLLRVGLYRGDGRHPVPALQGAQ